MIFDAFLQVIYGGIAEIIQLFPLSAGYPTEVTTAFAYLGGYFGMLDPLVPTATLATCVALVLTYELLIFAFKMLQWIYSKIPIFGR